MAGTDPYDATALTSESRMFRVDSNPLAFPEARGGFVAEGTFPPPDISVSIGVVELLGAWLRAPLSITVLLAIEVALLAARSGTDTPSPSAAAAPGADAVAGGVAAAPAAAAAVPFPACEAHAHRQH
eukprot:CAMPEP_0114496520 /NCGR_PEP_ID=MMETSP0109-20121206/5815_1 /TAXON_ID=29199 /ORGANISM="Chlorarachnion reptans, Strain CCCM449" /LENGTH=126 /DNA_ID=CAMNT_0001673801 /DNA_START=114 /DNA_END=496 /DNA_ORIENTATION=-